MWIMLRATVTLFTFCCIALTAASTSDGPSFVSWTVADEALIVRWRDESTPRCGFFVSVEKATVYEQDGFLDFGAPDFLQAAGDTRSIVVHGLLPNATYRIAIISCYGEQELKASEAFILDTLQLKFLTARFLTVTNATSSTAILQWSHAYKHSLNHVRFKLECHGLRNYPKRGQNGVTKIYFEDVIAPSATGVVTYTASSLTSNCRYTCRLKSIGEGSESPAYDEITFTTADGTPSPPPRPEIEARLLKGVPFVLKLYPAFGIVSRYKLHLLKLGALSTQAAVAISNIERAVKEHSVSKIGAFFPVTIATFNPVVLPPEVAVDRQLKKVLKQNTYYSFILEACGDDQDREQEVCSLSPPATPAMFIDHATVQEWTEQQEAVARRVALMVALPVAMVMVMVVVALLMCWKKKKVKGQKENLPEQPSTSDSDSFSDGEQQIEHFQQRYRGHPWKSSWQKHQSKQAAVSKQKVAPVPKCDPGPSHPPPLSHPLLAAAQGRASQHLGGFDNTVCLGEEVVQHFEERRLIHYSQGTPPLINTTTENLPSEKAPPTTITMTLAPIMSTSEPVRPNHHVRQEAVSQCAAGSDNKVITSSLGSQTTPCSTATLPLATPSKPCAMPSEPCATPSEPLAITSATPSVTTSLSLATPSIITSPSLAPPCNSRPLPLTRSSLPLATPSLPLATPSLPLATPSLPLATPSLSLATPSLPLATPSLSLATPSLPLATPSLPLATPSLPLATPSLSLATPSLPLATPSLSLATPSLPLATPSLPLATPSLPLATPSLSLATPSLLLATPSLPSTVSASSENIWTPSRPPEAPKTSLAEAPYSELLHRAHIPLEQRGANILDNASHNAVLGGTEGGKCKDGSRTEVTKLRTTICTKCPSHHTIFLY